MDWRPIYVATSLSASSRVFAPSHHGGVMWHNGVLSLRTGLRIDNTLTRCAKFAIFYIRRLIGRPGRYAMPRMAFDWTEEAESACPILFGSGSFGDWSLISRTRMNSIDYLSSPLCSLLGRHPTPSSYSVLSGGGWRNHTFQAPEGKCAYLPLYPGRTNFGGQTCVAIKRARWMYRETPVLLPAWGDTGPRSLSCPTVLAVGT